jgi:hypothetical protein
MTDAEWRRAVIEKWGPRCRSCGFANYSESRSGLQADHLIPRSQGGKNDVENGLVLCAPFIPGDSRFLPLRPEGGCHMAVTEGKRYRNIEWLEPEQLGYLSDQGWLWIGKDGSLYGRGLDYFTV